MCGDVYMYDIIMLILSNAGTTDIDIDVIFGEQSLSVVPHHFTTILLARSESWISQAPTAQTKGYLFHRLTIAIPSDVQRASSLIIALHALAFALRVHPAVMTVLAHRLDAAPGLHLVISFG